MGRSCMWPFPGENVLWQPPEEGPHGSSPGNDAVVPPGDACT